jgi:hypothetical protein
VEMALLSVGTGGSCFVWSVSASTLQGSDIKRNMAHRGGKCLDDALYWFCKPTELRRRWASLE